MIILGEIAKTLKHQGNHEVKRELQKKEKIGCSDSALGDEWMNVVSIL